MPCEDVRFGAKYPRLPLAIRDGGRIEYRGGER